MVADRAHKTRTGGAVRDGAEAYAEAGTPHRGTPTHDAGAPLSCALAPGGVVRLQEGWRPLSVRRAPLEASIARVEAHDGQAVWSPAEVVPWSRADTPPEGAPNGARGGAGLPLGRITSYATPPPRVDPLSDARRTVHPVRRSMYQLRDGLRPFQLARQRDCGTRRTTAGGVVLTAREGRASLSGVVRCGSVHTCPTCRMSIVSARREEIHAAVAWWGHERAAMVTFTMRHASWHGLARLRRGVAAAWRKMTQGAPWKRFCADVGLQHTIRALEITHGAHGWHPHFHALWFVTKRAALLDSIEWIRARWRDCVLQACGAEHAPNDHGVDVRTIDAGAADYLSKLGLEIADVGEKSGRHGSRSIWQLARDVTRLHGAHAADEDDVRSWREYAREIKGARQLTWSRRLKREAGILDRTDEEIVNETPVGVVVATIDAPTWSEIRRVRGVTIALIEGAERGGHVGVAHAVKMALLAAHARPRRWRNLHTPPPDAADTGGSP